MSPASECHGFVASAEYGLILKRVNIKRRFNIAGVTTIGGLRIHLHVRLSDYVSADTIVEFALVNNGSTVIRSSTFDHATSKRKDGARLDFFHR